MGNLKDIKDILKKNNLKIGKLSNIESKSKYTSHSSTWERMFTANILAANKNMKSGIAIKKLIDDLFIAEDYGFYSKYALKIVDVNSSEASEDVSPILSGFLAAFLRIFKKLDSDVLVFKYKIQIIAYLSENLHSHEELEDEFLKPFYDLINWYRLVESLKANWWVAPVKTFYFMSKYFEQIFYINDNSDIMRKGSSVHFLWFISSGFIDYDETLIRKIFNKETSVDSIDNDVLEIIAKLYFSQDIKSITDFDKNAGYLYCQPYIYLLNLLNNINDDGLKLQIILTDFN